MNHQRHIDLSAMLHDLEQFAVVVHANPGHVRITAAGIDHHKDLEAGNALIRHCRDLLGNRRRRIKIPVDDGVALIDRELLLEQRQTVWRRRDVRHTDTRRYATGGTLHRRGQDRVLILEAGLGAFAVMRMHVDDTRQDRQPTRIDHLVCSRLLARLVQAGNRAALDADRSAHPIPRGDQQAIFYHCVHSTVLLKEILRRSPRVRWLRSCVD